jgi:hypothetical protein
MDYREFYEVSKKSGTIKKSLRDDFGFRKWYNKNIKKKKL